MTTKIKHIHDYIKHRTKTDNAELHCETGPALIFTDGTVAWLIHNDQYTFETWCDKVNLSDDRLVELKLMYG